jgi:hypothetical protein
VARHLALFSLCFALYGCELVADFDRSKIPAADAGTLPKPDAAVAPPVSDSGPPSVPDAGNTQADASAVDEDAGG